MSQLSILKRGNAPTHSGPLHAPELQIDQPLLYFLACSDLRSEDPAARRPAITALLVLARQGTVTIRGRATEILKQEFGPGVATHGFLGCAAPRSAVCAFGDYGPDCHNCPWHWPDEAL